jgi:hypothetical protein
MISSYNFNNFDYEIHEILRDKRPDYLKELGLLLSFCRKCGLCSSDFSYTLERISQLEKSIRYDELLSQEDLNWFLGFLKKIFESIYKGIEESEKTQMIKMLVKKSKLN